MSHEVTEAGRNEAGQESSRQSPPVSQDVVPIVHSARDLEIPSTKIPHYQLSSGPQEIWVPYYIHTAKCDRCGKHNTSVVQRSSRENKQFCKPCMHLNVSDGIYSVNIEKMDWTPQIASVRRPTKPRKARQSKKDLVVNPTPTRKSKRKRNEPKPYANKRMRLTEQPDNASRSDDSLFGADDEASNEGEETDDNVGFGQLLPGSLFSSEKLGTNSMEPTGVSGTAGSLISADEKGESWGNTSEKEIESPLAWNINKPEQPPWWEQTQAPESNARTEPHEALWDSNVHFSPIERRRSKFSPEAFAAADILLMLAQDPRGFSVAGIGQGH